jgi:predicted enzyme related to lactoylglutathione lyase
MPQPIVYVEMGTADVPRAAEFYSYIFGWEFADPTQTAYSTFSSGPNGLTGGIFRADQNRLNGTIVLYIMVDDIDLFCEKIISAGGEVVVARSVVPGIGHYAHFKDPSGNLLGLFTPNQ